MVESQGQPLILYDGSRSNSFFPLQINKATCSCSLVHNGKCSSVVSTHTDVYVICTLREYVAQKMSVKRFKYGWEALFCATKVDFLSHLGNSAATGCTEAHFCLQSDEAQINSIFSEVNLMMSSPY